MKIIQFFLFFLCFSCISADDFYIPLKKTYIPLQGLSLNDKKLYNDKIKAIPYKNFIKTIKSIYMSMKFFILLQNKEKALFFISPCTNFYGLWMKDPMCYDCGVKGQTRKCSKTCIFDKNFTKTYECEDCQSISKNYTIPNLKYLIKRSKYVFSDIEINRFGRSSFDIREYPIVLATETRNLSLIKGDGQFGLRLDPLYHMDPLSLLYKKQIIAKKSFAFYININDNENYISSHISFSSSNKALYLENNLKYLPFDPENFSINIKGLQIDENLLNFTYNEKAFFDVNYAFIGVNEDILKEIIENIQKIIKEKCDIWGYLIFCYIEDIYLINNSKIRYIFNDKIDLSMPISNLFDCKAITQYKIANYCLLRVRKNKTFRLGSPFFEYFYSFFDFETLKVGFGTAENNENGTNFLENTKKIEEINWKTFFYLACLMILFLMLLMGILVKRKIFLYSSVKAHEHSLNEIDHNEGISANNESFVAPDSFHFEYELYDMKKKSEEEKNFDEKLSPITRKYMIEQQHDITVEKNEKEEENIENSKKDSILEEKDIKQVFSEFENKVLFDKLNEEIDENTRNLGKKPFINENNNLEEENIANEEIAVIEKNEDIIDKSEVLYVEEDTDKKENIEEITKIEEINENL